MFSVLANAQSTHKGTSFQQNRDEKHDLHRITKHSRSRTENVTEARPVAGTMCSIKINNRYVVYGADSVLLGNYKISLKRVVPPE